MPFVHEPPINLKYSPLSVSYNNGDRFYEVEPGVLCPSITSVLSVNSKDSIAKWRKRVGNEEADKVSLKARFRGNEVHDLCERFVNNEEQLITGQQPTSIEMFNVLKPSLEKYLTKVYHVEVPLYSVSLGIAGRVDLIGEWMGIPAIIDFKTSAKPKRENWISNYYMQCAGYSVMYEELTGIKIDHGLILISVAGNMPKMQAFPSPVKDWIQPLKDTIKRYRDEMV